MDPTNAMQNGHKAQLPAPLNRVLSFSWGGDEEFVMETKAKLGAKAIGRRGVKNVEGYQLRESQSPYNRVFDPETCGLRLNNDHLWHVS